MLFNYRRMMLEAAPAVAAAPAPAAAPVAATPAPAPAPAATSATTAPAAKPVAYDIKLPNDTYMKPADVEKITAFAKERNLSPEQAQAIVDRDHAERVGYMQSLSVQMEDQGKSWLAELKVHPKLGGANWEATETNVKRAFQIGDPTGVFRKSLEESHLQYYPGLVEFLNVLGATRKEDGLTVPVTAAPDKDTRSPREKLEEHYRNSAKK